ncbi:MAG TPA: phage holin family protein [Pyrinomonadaceae bacterium]|nr:phage holin family protein [Pyrinomonadaceae bacterium]
MVASATGAKLDTSTPAVIEKDESLPSLFSRLGDDVMQLFDTKLSLLKVEIKEEANEYARDGIMIGVGGVIAAIGFALFNVAVAFGISTLFANVDISQPAKYAIGFLTAGVLYLIVGFIVITAMKKRLAKQSLVPDRTVKELRKDKQWLKNEL